MISSFSVTIPSHVVAYGVHDVDIDYSKTLGALSGNNEGAVLRMDFGFV